MAALPPTQHVFPSLLAHDLDPKLRRPADLASCTAINKLFFFYSCLIVHSKIPDNTLGKKFFPQFYFFLTASKSSAIRHTPCQSSF